MSLVLSESGTFVNEFMNMMKSRGPSMEPWGTPEVCEPVVDSACVDSVCSRGSLSSGPDMTNPVSEFITCRWETESNAFRMLKNPLLLSMLCQ